MKESSKREQGYPLSLVVFGAVIGTVSSTLLHTSRGKQLVHDATRVFDDFVSLLEHVLDDGVSFEDSLDGARTFNDHVQDKLQRVNAFEPKPITNPPMPHVTVQPQPQQESGQGRVLPVHVPTQQSSAFLYHKPVQSVPAKQPQKSSVRGHDPDVALLHKLSRSIRP